MSAVVAGVGDWGFGGARPGEKHGGSGPVQGCASAVEAVAACAWLDRRYILRNEVLRERKGKPNAQKYVASDVHL